VILVGWQLDPARVASVTHPQLRACWLLVDEDVLEARLRADTAFYQGCTDVERFIRYYLARSRWVNDRVRQAAVHEAGVVLEVGPGETVDTLGRAACSACGQRRPHGDGESVTGSQETRPGKHGHDRLCWLSRGGQSPALWECVSPEASTQSLWRSNVVCKPASPHVFELTNRVTTSWLLLIFDTDVKSVS
jgi:hypothetical protein